jgi:hypothetical protein
VVNHPDGWVEGPQIKGKIIPPSSDTLRNMGNGVNRLDVRLTIQTDDDRIIYVSYNGINHCSKEVRDRFLSDETLHTGDYYFITAPTFETKSERYGFQLLDAERGLSDDTRQTVSPTSSAISNPPVRSTAKPTGLPRA